jgi:glyoxylase-like metal-dependent hydrolase (beta-lactamase superfamily II)
MKITTFEAGYIGTNAFLLTDTERGEAILFDAPHNVSDHVQRVLDKEGCTLKTLVLTHGHWDHTGDAAKIRSEGVEVLAHEADRPLIEDPSVMSIFFPPGIDVDPCTIDRFIGEGDTIDVLGRTGEVRHVPGHCAGNILVYLEDEAVAIVGDALFAGSIGRTDLPGGDFETLATAIRTRIYTLPDDTRVLCGHGPETTVGREARSNPFVPRK